MATVEGPEHVTGEIDDEGHETFGVRYKVRTARGEGPRDVMYAAGLPAPGAFYNLAGLDRPNVWAWRRPAMKVTPFETGEDVGWYYADLEFSTKPLNRCQDAKVENPLQEPQKVSGSFVKFTEEGVYDRHGNVIGSSSHELFRGQQNEWDNNRPTVKIEQNVLNLDLHVFAAMVDNLNSVPMWGVPRRYLKLMQVSWEKKWWGLCSAYYTRTLEFEVSRNSFDREMLDEGTKVLSGQWDAATGRWVLRNVGGLPPDRNNPSHFIRFTDRQNNECRVILDGRGEPYNPDPIPQTRDCTQCTNGSPSQWAWTGLGDLGDMGVSAALLEYAAGGGGWPGADAGCTWEATGLPDGGSLALFYHNDEWNLQYDTASFTILYKHPRAGWRCLGPNTLTRSSSSPAGAEGPAAITITGYPQLPGPGFFLIEKYGESNFFLLGVPTVL